MAKKKKRGSSCFAVVVKRAFCSSSKECNLKSRRKETKQQDQDKIKANVNHQCHYNQEGVALDVDLAVAAAQAAAATAQAAAEVARLTPRSTFVMECYNAAVVIQTAFRGYLARRALLALKGIVKLQAFIRGYNVRKQAKLTLKCMQALVRLQAQMCDQQARLSQERCRRSMFAECNDLWDRYKLDFRQRKSTSAERAITKDEWDFFPCMIEDDRSQASLKREKALAYAFSQQLWRFDRDINNRTEWLNRWMATKEWDSITMRGSSDRKDSNIRTIHVDTTTPLSCKTKLSDIRSASPRRHSTTNTPSSGSKYSCNRCMSSSSATTPHYMTATESAKAKARAGTMSSQRSSTPGRERVRKRLSYPVSEPNDSDHTDNSSFSQSLRSPSFKSVFPALERGGYPSSHYCESGYGEVSPASTTHIRRWVN